MQRTIAIAPTPFGNLLGRLVSVMIIIALLLGSFAVASDLIKRNQLNSTSFNGNGPLTPTISLSSIQPHLGGPESYLGVGNPLAVQRGSDMPMRLQNLWLSLHSPGTPKENGDPYTSKWDYTVSGCSGCFPVGGQFQPEHDTAGYNYGLYIPNNTGGDLQIYDAAYQPKPGTNGVENPHFSQAHPCADYNALPSSCSSGNQPDFNRLATRWCASNNTDTGDNEPGAPSQCDTQAMSATIIYSLYYPDNTPDYFGDDVLASSWTVPASPLTGTNDGIHMVSSYAYSQTWTNFNDQPGGYPLYPYNGYHQWRLNVNVPLDNDHSVQGVAAQNNYGIRVKTADSGIQVYALSRMPMLNLASGVTDYYAVNIPAQYGGQALDLDLFDLGDGAGDNYVQLIAPPDATHSVSYPVSINIYAHDGRHNPPGPDTVLLNQDRIDTTRPTYNYNDDHLDAVYNIPPNTQHGGTFQGGYFLLRYTVANPFQDRITMKVKVCPPSSPAGYCR